MEQIKQLKAMRDAARVRIEALPDYKLMTSLDALIADLEKAFGDPGPDAASVAAKAAIKPEAKPEQRAQPSPEHGGATGILNGKARKATNPEEDAIDQAVAELEAELVSSGVAGKND